MHLILKLQRLISFSTEEKAALIDATRCSVRQAKPGQILLQEGDKPLASSAIRALLSGWVCRYKQLADGRRQIIAICIPGDLGDLNVSVLRHIDHSVVALTPIKYAEISQEAMGRLTACFPRVAQALSRDMLVMSAIQREWIVRLGRRNALDQVGQLLCELFVRLHNVRLVIDGTCHIPLTQIDLADALGLSTVHVNRSLQELRSTGLVVLRGRMLHVPDLPALQAATLFNPSYLQLECHRQGAA